MYQFVDRRIIHLAPGSRLVLWAMRGWVRALGARQCPSGSIAPGFIHCRVIDALPPFHHLMILLNVHALDIVHVAELGHSRVIEGEALILCLWADAQSDPSNARATLRLLVEEEAIEPALEALIAASGRLAATGLAFHGFVAA